MRAHDDRNPNPGRVLGALLLCFIAATGPRAAAAGERGRWSVQVAGGVSSMQLDDLKGFYQQVLEYYRSNGVPVETQREFPANLIVGGDLLYGRPGGFRYGFGGRYTWSHAYALYGDYGGTLDVVGEVRLTAVQGIFQKEWSTSGLWSPFLELRVGRGYVKLEVTEEVALTGIGVTTGTLTGDGSGPLAELHAGVTRPLGSFYWNASAGYRYCNVPGPPFDLNLSGFVTALGLGRTF